MLEEKTLNQLKEKLGQNPELKNKFENLMTSITEGKEITDEELQKKLEKNPEILAEYKALMNELCDGVELSAKELEAINGGIAPIFAVLIRLGIRAIPKIIKIVKIIKDKTKGGDEGGGGVSGSW